MLFTFTLKRFALLAAAVTTVALPVPSDSPEDMNPSLEDQMHSEVGGNSEVVPVRAHWDDVHPDHDHDKAILMRGFKTPDLRGIVNRAVGNSRTYSADIADASAGASMPIETAVIETVEAGSASPRAGSDDDRVNFRRKPENIVKGHGHRFYRSQTDNY